MEKELGIDVARDESIPDGEAKKCHPYRCIDKDMLTVKLGYAFHFAALGAWLPFELLFLTSLDLNPLLAGLILSLQAVASSLATPLWGFVSDFTGRKKIVMTIIPIGLAATILPAPFVAVRLNDFTRNSSSLIDHNNQTSLTDRKYCTTSCGDNRMFYGMLVLFIATGFFDNVMPVFLDSNAMHAIESHSKKTSFGKQRVFSTITFGIGSVVAGAFAESFNHAYMSSFSAVVFTAVPFLLAGLPFYLLVVV